jgi:hypothetical protein
MADDGSVVLGDKGELRQETVAVVQLGQQPGFHGFGTAIRGDDAGHQFEDGWPVPRLFCPDQHQDILSRSLGHNAGGPGTAVRYPGLLR